MSNKIEVKQVVTIAEHSSLPAVLVIFNLVKQITAGILTHLYQSFIGFLRMLLLLKFKYVLLTILRDNSDRFILKHVPINMDHFDIFQWYLNFLPLIRCIHYRYDFNTQLVFNKAFSLVLLKKHQAYMFTFHSNTLNDLFNLIQMHRNLAICLNLLLN
jgi:hypothetical protein